VAYCRGGHLPAIDWHLWRAGARRYGGVNAIGRCDCPPDSLKNIAKYGFNQYNTPRDKNVRGI